VRGSITRFTRFRGLGSAYDHGQKEVYSTSFPEPLLQNASRTPDYCGRSQNEVYPGCEVDSKGGGQRLKEQGFIRWGVTDPLQPPRKTRFIRLWPRNADSRGAKSHVPQAVGPADTGLNEVYPVCELDSQRGGQRSKNEVYPVRRLMGVPLEELLSEVCPVLGRL